MPLRSVSTTLQIVLGVIALALTFCGGIFADRLSIESREATIMQNVLANTDRLEQSVSRAEYQADLRRIDERLASIDSSVLELTRDIKYMMRPHE